jgi:hypothetical protein
LVTTPQSRGTLGSGNETRSMIGAIAAPPVLVALMRVVRGLERRAWRHHQARDEAQHLAGASTCGLASGTTPSGRPSLFASERA